MPASFHVFGHMWQRSSKLFQSLVNKHERRIAPRRHTQRDGEQRVINGSLIPIWAGESPAEHNSLIKTNVNHLVE